MTSPDDPKQQAFDLEPSTAEDTNAKQKSQDVLDSKSNSEETNTLESIEHEVLTPEHPSNNDQSEAIEPEFIEPEAQNLTPLLIEHEVQEKFINRAAKESHIPSNKETREVVTPYAFTVSSELLGHPLATPSRRALAMLIDLFCISVLSTLSALFLAGFVALTFFKAGGRLKQQKRFNILRLALRGTAAALIFSILFVIVSDMGEPEEGKISQISQEKENKDNMRSLLDLAAVLISESCQENSACLLQAAESAAVDAAAMNIPLEDINATASDIVSQKDWSEENKVLFMDVFISTLNEEKNAYTDDVLEITEASQVTKSAGQINKLIARTEKIISELGNGLGWAALYFSVLTAWWRGQTIGKKMMGIEVVKLDGNYPSLWESFGRYGGYAAGFATGLSGFFQVCWDPNRQAIQDKISETLVLRLKPKK
jgi:uncharacterized RDD family membrane protein YckC